MEIGGTVIGGKQLHSTEDGQPLPKLKPPKGFIPGKGATASGPVVETLAKALSKSEGGKVEMMSDEELEELNLSPESIDQFRKELEKIAGEKGWVLEVVEMPGEALEIRGIVDDDEDDWQAVDDFAAGMMGGFVEEAEADFMDMDHFHDPWHDEFWPDDDMDYDDPSPDEYEDEDEDEDGLDDGALD